MYTKKACEVLIYLQIYFQQKNHNTLSQTGIFSIEKSM